jgi:mannose-6-phosphate isomerase
MSQETLQPLVIEPKATAAIWGGEALVRVYGKRGDPEARLGESWECWDENAVRNGPYAGRTIGELRELLGARLMGSLEPERIFPVLTKIIDAREALSVQVHPDDAYARRVEHACNGKTECWVILAAQPGAELVLGWSRSTSREEYERRVRDGTLGEILRRVPVKPNDAFYLPAGTLHAIGAGIQLFETQQASDLTYRIFDWNRVGPDGKPRPLHVERAADVLDFGAGTQGPTRHLHYQVDGIASEAYVGDRRFVVERIEVSGDGGVLRPDGEPLIVMTESEAAVLRAGEGTTHLGRWTTALIPAAIDALEVFPVRGGATTTAFSVTPARDVFVRRLERAGVAASERDDFLAQFTTAPARV